MGTKLDGPQIRRLAIVNRGEAAMRALTAISELNLAGGQPPITTVALYTDPDARAWYVRQADEAVPLGPASYVDPADGHRKSGYLDEAKVVAALRRARVDAVWPGWGFLSERASFVRRCEEAGIVFVGPDSATIELLGDKMAAKRLAERAGLAVVPWSDGPVAGIRQARAAADRLGYPVIIKAAAGGGGRGIRVVRDPAGLVTALESARSEAELAFGDGTVFIERLVAPARHVEVQVIADGQGTVWSLGVRDCSIQRRHQKVIEESACTALSAQAEEAIERAAVTLATAADYRNAGTVEFLLPSVGDGFMFMEVNPRLQVEHPVTEMTTGIDLVKLQLRVAAGDRLDGAPPRPAGHAIEARLCAEDPGHGFEPAPGRLAVFSMPAGAGIRVDTGVRQGDEVSAEFDSMIAKVIAWGQDRPEALSRLRRALGQATVVVPGGATNRSFLLTLLGRPELQQGTVHNDWLDQLIESGAEQATADPVALLQAGVESCDLALAAERAAFRARAARGSPGPVPTPGHACQLRYHGASYRLHVYRTGPDRYRIACGGALADITVDRLNAHERRVAVNGRWHHVMTAADGPVIRIEVDGTAHRLSADDDGGVRSECPGVVVGVQVSPGDEVAAGDPLAVLESMKMETVVTAPSGGTVTRVDVAVNEQVEAGELLLRIRAGGPPDSSAGAAPLDLADLAAPPDLTRAPGCVVYPVLRNYLLGYDLDPVSARDAISRQRRIGQTTDLADPELLRYEDELLGVFTDVAALSRPKTAPEGDGRSGGAGGQEYLRRYLQWLDPERAGLPAGYRDDLSRVLRHYGVRSLDATPELTDATAWLLRSLPRADVLAPVVTGILERQVRLRTHLSELAAPDLRHRMDRLIAVTEGQHQDVANLARAVRFHYLDEPLLEEAVRSELAAMEQHLQAMRDAPDGPGRRSRIGPLVQCRQMLEPLLLSSWRSAGQGAEADAFRAVLLEVLTRRFYRIRDLAQLTVTQSAGPLLCAADYDVASRQIHLVVACLPLEELPELAPAMAGHLAEVPPGREIVVDVHTWRPGPGISDVDTAAQVTGLVARCGFGRRLRRLDVTVTSLDGASPDGHATQHVTLRQPADGRFEEDLLYRNVHPMLAKRLELWRLSGFRLRRLPSPADVYLFHGVARDDPEDERLFALAEVRDLVPVPSSGGAVSYPRLELMGLSAGQAMRAALATLPGPNRPKANQIVLSVRPPWEAPSRDWLDIARSFGPLAAAVGLEKVILRVRIPGPGGGLRDSVLHIDGIGRAGTLVREQPAGQVPIQALSPYQQKVLRAHRFGAPYPYEIVQMLAPQPGTVARFPAGTFEEYDLDDTDALGPVRRDYGQNKANVVVGLLTSYTAKVPEGMTRVVILSDPTQGLGNVAEPECRRILAALELAQRKGLPVEWFALSSGARIALDSGTENMDWTAAVLRGLIEFTQAGGEVNVVVTGINVGAQAYWNAEATMLMHTRGILIMTPGSAMVLTGKQSLDYSGGVSAEDNFGIGGFDRVMGPNGQAQYWAPTLEEACQILLRHYEHTFIVPGERHPRRAATTDAADRDIRAFRHPLTAGGDFGTVGDVFSGLGNAERKKPFDIRAVLRAVTDADASPLERWAGWRGADTAVVWDAHIGGIPLCLIGVEAQPIPRGGFVPTDGPASWTSGTLFPQSARKLARAINAASGNRPLVVLANLSGFDGSPESMRRWQLEYGAELGRAITNFRGPIVFVVITRCHGGAFVVFSKRLNDRMEIAAVAGSFASVIGGAPAAATVFAREARARTEADPRVRELRAQLSPADGEEGAAQARLSETSALVRSEKLGELARDFDQVHSVDRARAVGSVDRIIPASELRPYLIGAVERGLAREPKAASSGPGGGVAGPDGLSAGAGSRASCGDEALDPGPGPAGDTGLAAVPLR